MKEMAGASTPRRRPYQEYVEQTSKNIANIEDRINHLENLLEPFLRREKALADNANKEAEPESDFESFGREHLNKLSEISRKINTLIERLVI